MTAALVVVFMRVGDYVENFTTESARRAVKELTALAAAVAQAPGVQQVYPALSRMSGRAFAARAGALRNGLDCTVARARRGTEGERQRAETDEGPKRGDHGS